jgi:hypothetical protein
MWLNRLRRVVENVHLVYLGLLPVLATFSLLVVYGHPAPTLLFLGGVVAVSVYLVVVFNYTRPTQSLRVALFVLFDGPFWALLSILAGGSLFSFAADAFLIDGVAIWLAIVWLAVSTSRPSQGQRIATVGFALFAVSSLLFAFWPYLREQVFGEWVRLLSVGVGIVEAVVARHYWLEVDEPVRDGKKCTEYILILLSAWIVAFCVGNILYEMGG